MHVDGSRPPQNQHVTIWGVLAPSDNCGIYGGSTLLAAWYGSLGSLGTEAVNDYTQIYATHNKGSVEAQDR